MKFFESTCQNYAQLYQSLGWSVFPIRRGTKSPAITTWKPLQTEALDASQIRQLPWEGVGIVTGRVSGLVVIDVDTASPNEKVRAFLAELPGTATVETTKGFHFYFHLSDRSTFIPSRTGFLPGVDIRGEGGYVVAPPSIHPSGEMYVWAADHTLDDGVSVLPQRILEKLQETPPPLSVTHGADAIHDVHGPLPAGAPEGMRNTRETQIAGAWLARTDESEWESVVWPRIVEWGKTCTPPIVGGEDLKHLRQTFLSIARRERVRRGDIKKIEDRIKKNRDIFFEKDRLQHEAQTHSVTSFDLRGLLENTSLKEIPPTIPGLLPAGVVLLIGKPKLGKSRLALQYGLAVSAGKRVFRSLNAQMLRCSSPAIRGKVLYLALEDAPLRVRSRAQELMKNMSITPEEVDVDVFCEWDSPIGGGLSRLRHFVQEGKYRLIIIDTLAAFFQNSAKNKGNAFTQDYDMLRPMLEMMRGQEQTLLVITHARKDQFGMNDPFDSVAGTLGYSAVADTVSVMYETRQNKRAKPKPFLALRGRDIDERTYPLAADGLTWEVADQEHDD